MTGSLSDHCDSRPLGYLTLAPDGAIRQLSTSAGVLLGDDRSRLIGRRFASLVSARDRAELDACLQRAFASTASQTCEVGILREDRESLVVRMDAARGESGLECRATLTDITEHRRLDTAARVQHHLAVVLGSTGDLKAALDQVLEAVCQLDGVDCGGAYLLAPRRGSLNLSAQHGLSPGFVADVTQYAAESSQVLQARRNAPTQAEIPASGQLPQTVLDREGLQAILVIPILHQGCFLGLLSAASRTQPHLPRTTQRAVETIAAQIGGMLARISSEQFARGTIEALPAQLGVLDETGTIIAVNRTWREFAVASQADPSLVSEGANYLAACDLAAGPDRDAAAAFAAGIRAVMAGRRDEFSLEYTCHSPGVQRWLLGRVTRFPGPGPARVVVCHEDITRRKEAEEQIRQSQVLLQAVTEGTPDAVCVKDRQGRYLMVNGSMLRWFGRTQAEVLGCDDTRLFSPNEARRIMEMDRQVMDSGSTQTFEESAFLGGEPHTFLSTRGPVRDPWGGVVGVFGISRDITTRKRVEEALRESEERLSLAVWATNDAVWDCNLATGVVWWNDAYAAMFGPRPRDVQGSWQWWIDHIHPEDRERVVMQLHTTLDSQESHCVAEYRHRRIDGNWATVIDRAYVARDANGKPRRILGAMQDITEQKAGEERRQLLQLQLAHLGRLSTMGEFVAGIAHEVNQPLYSIVNYANACRNLLARGSPDLGELSEWTREIAVAAVRAGEIIKRLRGFLSRPKTRRLPVRVNEIIEESIALVAFETRRLRVTVQLIPAEEDPTAEMDRVEIQQVLVNLLRNAWEAVSENPIEARTLAVRTAAVAGLIEISIADNGPGLPELEGRNLFEPFVTTKPHGLGMGLAISRTIVEAHGGRIWATPNPDAGATFHFTLPATEKTPSQGG